MEQITLALMAVMPGAVLAILSSARDKLEWSGSWSVLMRVHLTRYLFAWASVVIEDALEG